MPISISKKRKFIADGVFYAELNDTFTKMIGASGYSGLEVRRTPVKTEIVIRSTKTMELLGDKGRRIRELTTLVQSRFNLPAGSVFIFAEPVRNRALSAIAQAEAIHFKMSKGLPVRRAVYGIMRYVMEAGGKGLEVVVSGKLRAARAKAMKFRDGYMIKSGDNRVHYVETAIRHLKMKAGTLGIRVSIMKPYDATGRNGTTCKPADTVTIIEPKDV